MSPLKLNAFAFLFLEMRTWTKSLIHTLSEYNDTQNCVPLLVSWLLASFIVVSFFEGFSPSLTRECPTFPFLP